MTATAEIITTTLKKRIILIILFYTSLGPSLLRFDASRKSICVKESIKNVFLIETPTNFNGALLNCNALRGELFLTMNDYEVDML